MEFLVLVHNAQKRLVYTCTAWAKRGEDFASRSTGVLKLTSVNQRTLLLFTSCKYTRDRSTKIPMSIKWNEQDIGCNNATNTMEQIIPRERRGSRTSTRDRVDENKI